MIWLAAYLLIALAFAMLGVTRGAFTRRSELPGDVTICLVWLPALAWLAYQGVRDIVLARRYR